MARYWFRFRRLLLHNVLHADDTPHAIAMGVAIAMFVAFLPIVGIQTLVAVGLTALCRVNKAVCIPIVWITNPATMVPIYYGCFAVGRALLPSGRSASEEDVDRLLAWARDASVFESAFWSNLLRVLAEIGVELWVGCAVVGFVLGAVSYGLSRWAVSNYRERRRRRILQRSLFRAKLRSATVTRRSETA